MRNSGTPIVYRYWKGPNNLIRKVILEGNRRKYSHTSPLQLSWFPCSLGGCGPESAIDQDVLKSSPQQADH